MWNEKGDGDTSVINAATFDDDDDTNVDDDDVDHLRPAGKEAGVSRLFQEVEEPQFSSFSPTPSLTTQNHCI